jgi:hypothetical protein
VEKTLSQFDGCRVFKKSHGETAKEENHVFRAFQAMSFLPRGYGSPKEDFEWFNLTYSFK